MWWLWPVTLSVTSITDAVFNAGLVKQCAEKRSCVGRDLSERVTFWSQSTDGQEQRLKTNIQWSTQLRFLGVAYFAKFVTPDKLRGHVFVRYETQRRKTHTGTQLNDVLWSWRARFQMPSNCSPRTATEWSVVSCWRN